MKIAVVGAGISGLTCGFRLRNSGHDVTVFEQDPAVGGRMSTVDVGGFQVDTGANLLLANYERLRALLDELGLPEEFFEFQSGSGGILHHGELSSFAPASLGDVLKYRGLSVPSRLRLVAFFLGAHAWRSDVDFFDLSVGEDPLEELDAYTAVTRLLGREVADNLVDPFVRTFHFHSARRVSMKYFDALAALFVARHGFSTHGLRQYMRALPEALAAQLDTHCSTRVTAVETAADGVWVRFHGERRRFDAVVMATPAPVTAQLLATPTPAQTRLLEQVHCSRTVSVAFTVPLDTVTDFEGIWVPFSERRLISGCSNETCKGSRTQELCVLNFGLHEEGAEPLLGRPDAELYAAVADEWTRLFPAYLGQLTGLHVQRWTAALPVYGVGTIGNVRRFWEHGQGDGRVFLCGDYLNHPWVEGSIRCGEKVARLI